MRGKERGSLALESAVILPLFVAVLFLIFWFTVIVQSTSSSAQTAAEEAARAASQQVTVSGARSAANNVVQSGSTSEGVVCSVVSLEADLSPNGFVEVAVTCSGTTKGFMGFASRDISKTATAIEVVDKRRSGGAN